MGTVGGFVLCTRGRHAPVRVLGVRPRVGVGTRPLAVRFWVRTIRLADVASAAPRRRPDFEPVGSALGAPPRWAQPYRDAAYPGRYSPAVRGLVVRRPCAATQRAWAALDRGRVPEIGYHELMVALTVDARGGRLDGFDLTYEQAGHRAVLRTTWVMTACGTAFGRRDHCPAR